MKSLLLGHGRKHRKLSSVNYDTSVFVDRDEQCAPDIVIDVVKNRLDKNLTGIFDEVVTVCSGSAILHTCYGLNGNVIKDIYRCLKPGGRFYTSNIYYAYPKYQNKESEKKKLVRDLQALVDFEYLAEEERPDIQSGCMLVFVKKKDKTH